MAEVRLDSATKSPTFAMSVDVEDYFQVWAFSDVVARADWDGYELRVEEATKRILDLFDKYTFPAD